MASEKEKMAAWAKARKMPGKNPDTHRKDDHGSEIYYASYGKQSPMGWEIDHKKPVSKGGSEHPKNKRPLQWQNNRSKGSKYPHK